MSDFVFLYRGGDRPTGSPEQLQQQMQRWMNWMKTLGEKGHLKDAGHPLEQSGKVVRAHKNVHDGPFAEAKDVIGGYTLVHASDLAHAVELTHGCPIFEIGGAVEVRPIMQMSM
jgi:hypothetical protein